MPQGKPKELTAKEKKREQAIADLAPRTHLAAEVWGRRLNQEEHAAAHALQWQERGFSQGCEAVAPLNHNYRTFSTPTFVQPFGGPDVESAARGLSLPRLTGRSTSRGSLRLEDIPTATPNTRARKTKALVERAIREELEKTVLPLQEAIRAEQAARKTAEAELVALGGGGKDQAKKGLLE
mmetsp:Transcript_12551/g.19023  ORF Transcript_12551/g.19023 Transcript_12551/m.19023 type:complete len:181 (-) Transcript_12551:90-632(-)|eukprot:CAMPEP_0206590332 /NCGR_PEP_ID=MMETSP0325_2-20121206/39546_1 /ASSEMBLY_ACC=CAM_ASM_000347 /TAXON_ID=2866 /ORGANISM="Crypthecodinium cohnii, Strain Seligo" /LENGTH=180 /DNA_ID=CAMNT_0054099243 /DNA_START=53 /DNA_END=595 /DNA_ORIENTATION=+